MVVVSRFVEKMIGRKKKRRKKVFCFVAVCLVWFGLVWFGYAVVVEMDVVVVVSMDVEDRERKGSASQ